MSGTLTDTLKNLGLSDAQIGKLAALQETGRKLDFVYHATDDGRDPQQTASQFDDLRNRLATFAAEGAMTQQFAAALWDHLAPRFVGWRPGFIEGVEAQDLSGVLTRLDQAIDEKLGRDIPPDVREVSHALRTRFDDLLSAYEAGTWRDSRTSGEVRDALGFMASLDEKIRNVLYGNAREIDLSKTIEEYGSAREVGREQAFDNQFEARSYQAQLDMVSDILGRLRVAGIQLRADLNFVAPRETQEHARVDELAPTRSATARPRHDSQPIRRPSSDTEQYWRSVARSASTSPGISCSEALGQAVRRGRSI
jgi:hypothetical protein